MLGNFVYIKVELWNQMSNKSKKFHVTEYEELDRVYEQYNQLLGKDEFWKMLKSPYVKCRCGQMVSCENFTNTCNCGRDYNFSGTELAPRGQWGEETGEHWTECY
jgi:hypothetical protein